MISLALSQKQKIIIFLAILTLGFVILGSYTGNRLSELTNQYHLSSEVTVGASKIVETEVKLLTLAGKLDGLESSQVGSIKQEVAEINAFVASHSSFLSEVGLSRQATELTNVVKEFEQALLPWLALRAELGFNVDDGKLGMLKSIASTIEAKIAETGMVTINSDFQAMIKAQQNYLLLPTEKSLKMFNRAMAGFVNMSNTYAMLDLYEKEIEQFKETFIRVSELSQQLGDIEAQLAKSEMAAITVVKEIDSTLSSISGKYQATAQQSADNTRWSVLVACAVLALITIVIFITLSSSVSKALKNVTNIINSIAGGDLSQRLKVTENRNDEFNQLAISINQSCENLGQLVAGVQVSSEALSGDAAELNTSLDRLVENQSEVLGQTQLLASATEEVSVTTQEVSNSLEFVAEISRSSNQAAEEGGLVITEAIGSLESVGQILSSAAGHIQQLEAASTKVDSVMDIINGIAEQTNLLALNAAIEAARAGEQGRGFAVVADEVRSLAVRTVDAVGEISDTIETMKKESSEVIQYIGQSEQSMQAGQQKGLEAMQALERITEKADEANHQTEVIFSSIKELATTSQSMADSMIQISTAMKELEENNEQIRGVSGVVENRSGSLNQDCQKFTI
ncbi:methyl-accepting chemotaxis protein [Vibrio profundi]|uniref:methyl-accepting chemotaxis protein n=1 Tax=Vibrio profundi TaxID=1774960 RepID=UPI00373581C4